MSSTEPLVSVVTPIYNGRTYIGECIESVLAQTYENFEYIVMDNCSTDGTLELAREYEARDARMRVVGATEFLDAVPNANRALREISPESKYTKVLHGDDWLFPECLERMVALAEANPTVGIVGAYRLEGTKVTLDGLPHSISVIPGSELGRSTLRASEPYPFLFGSPSSLLIRSDLIRAREPFYNEANPYQDDMEACYQLLRESDFGFVHQVLTFTRRHAEAVMSRFTRIGGELPGQIDLLLKYGPYYLDEQEYHRRLAVMLARYGLFLAAHPQRLRDPEFRAHQGKMLSYFASKISPADVAAGIPPQLERMWRKRRGS
jgi:glycosyltransferase involved in cell wall biosynthesis